MSRLLVPALAIVALSFTAGCASSARQPAVPCSYAAQVPVDPIASQPPTDFEMDFAPPASAAPARFTHDKELTGSLRPQMSTRSNEE